MESVPPAARAQAEGGAGAPGALGGVLPLGVWGRRAAGGRWLAGLPPALRGSNARSVRGRPWLISTSCMHLLMCVSAAAGHAVWAGGGFWACSAPQ